VVQQPVRFFLSVGGWLALPFSFFVLEKLKSDARIWQLKSTVVDQEIEKGSEYANLEVDRSRGNLPSMLLTKFSAAPDLVMVDISSSNDCYVPATAQDPFKVLQDLPIAAQRARLVGRMCLHMLQMHFHGVCDQREVGSLCGAFR
jgi:hypothetical protein